jgi:hypothetical protein
MQIKKLRKLISAFEPVLQVTQKYEKALSEIGMWHAERATYETQKEHWQRWLKEYGGPGYYGRKNSDRDARFVYNHINCPPMLLWLCEAAGVKRSLVRLAMERALETQGSFPTQSREIRKTISWNVVELNIKNIT